MYKIEFCFHACRNYSGETRKLFANVFLKYCTALLAHFCDWSIWIRLECLLCRGRGNEYQIAQAKFLFLGVLVQDVGCYLQNFANAIHTVCGQ